MIMLHKNAFFPIYGRRWERWQRWQTGPPGRVTLRPARGPRGMVPAAGEHSCTARNLSLRVINVIVAKPGAPVRPQSAALVATAFFRRLAT